MPDPIDDSRVRSGSAAAQLAAVYFLGTLAVPLGAAVFVTLMFGDTSLAGIGVLLGLAAAVGLIFVAGTVTQHGSAATATPARRFGWALAVTAGGTAGVSAVGSLTLTFDLEYGQLAPWMLAAGLPYLAVAALFVGRRQRVLVLTVVVLLTGAATVAVRHEKQRQQAEADSAALRDQLQVPLDLIYRTDIPGYRRTAPPATVFANYEPIDQSIVKYWGEQNIIVTVSHTAVKGPDCGPEGLYSPALPPVLLPSDAPADAPAPVQPTPPPAPRPDQITCRADGASLFYRRGPRSHEYIRTAGDVVLRASAGAVVDKALLKAAVVAARPMTEAELRAQILHR